VVQKSIKVCKHVNEMREFAKNINSQNGEDGILEEILKRMEITDGWVCEFGAWDGRYASNTFELIKRGFRGVYIEGDPIKYQDLLKTVSEWPNITPIEAWVTPDNLDNLLKQTDCPTDFDVLSIDVDSIDYHIWQGLNEYRPKIVIIEIDSSIQPDVLYISDKGTSFRPMVQLGLDKGYRFLIHTGNIIFIREDLFSKVGYVEDPILFDTKWLLE
jgi:hypothetical protein